jgi:CRISPR-associated protein Cas5
MDYFEIELTLIPENKGNYDDLWSRAFRRTDSHRHTFGTRFMDVDFINRWELIKERVNIDNKRHSNEKNALLDKLFQRYISRFPMYYSTPTKREYCLFNGIFKIKMSMDSMLFNMLNDCFHKDNLGYLGSNEGWVNITIKEMKI